MAYYSPPTEIDMIFNPVKFPKTSIDRLGTDFNSLQYEVNLIQNEIDLANELYGAYAGDYTKVGVGDSVTQRNSESTYSQTITGLVPNAVYFVVINLIFTSANLGVEYLNYGRIIMGPTNDEAAGANNIGTTVNCSQSFGGNYAMGQLIGVTSADATGNMYLTWQMNMRNQSGGTSTSFTYYVNANNGQVNLGNVNRGQSIKLARLH
jgi:hypothetical protein